MTTTATAKTNKEIFVATSAKLISDAKAKGRNLTMIKALRGYMQEVLTGVPTVETDSAKARIIGEMYASDEQCANALLSFAREKAKYVGDDVPDAMVKIVEAGIGLYSQSSPLWKHLATVCLMDKKSDRDFLYLLANLTGELRYVADKANNLMNEVLVALGTKETKKGFKKTGKKADEPNAEGAQSEPAVSTETVKVADIESVIKSIQLGNKFGGLDPVEIAMVVCQYMVANNHPSASEIFSEGAIADAMAAQAEAESLAVESKELSATVAA